MRPVSPNTGAPERVYAEEQAEYLPLSVAEYLHGELADGKPCIASRTRVTAWVPKREELEAFADRFAQTLPGTAAASREQLIAAIAETFKALPIFLALVDFGTPLTPHMVTLGPQDWMLVGDRAD